MNVVIIVDNSAGNESVGEMWKETKIFQSTDKLEDVLKWVSTIGTPSKKNIVISLPNSD